MGVGPPTPTWGNMLADDQGSAGFGAWWFWVFPSIALLITTLGFNLLGELGARRPRPADRAHLRHAPQGGGGDRPVRTRPAGAGAGR